MRGDRLTDRSCVHKLTEIFARITLLPVRSLCARTTRHIGRCPLVRRVVIPHVHSTLKRAHARANPSAFAVVRRRRRRRPIWVRASYNYSWKSLCIISSTDFGHCAYYYTVLVFRENSLYSSSDFHRSLAAVKL